MTTTIVALDLETTGLDPERHHIWEIGAIVRGHRDPTFDGEWHYMLRPNLSDAEPKALQISRYYERASSVQDRTTQAFVHRKPAEVPGGLFGELSRPAVALRMAELLDGAHLVGVNPQFDAAFLSRFLRAHWQAPTWNYHLVDVGALAFGYAAALCQALDRPVPTLPWRLDDLAAQLGVPSDPASRHTALGDARWALAIYDKVMAASGAQDVPEPVV
ncbi:3'-5' exonuclease [Micromonospora craniellae]|uniref:3'-5' exonuclease n=1 Tax=Micromonospora craniellae TaxID=2294034 RepID=UPI001314BB1F|nr:3'-5' exonuclease [Micromonospora craniellae]QOC89862.1 3'-5' exonuclease [Micromonospora craniellae]